MSDTRLYRKKLLQPMRPYIVGEDLSGISVNKEDTPEEGGMIAVNPDNGEDRWYVAKQFFLDNYEEAQPTPSNAEHLTSLTTTRVYDQPTPLPDEVEAYRALLKRVFSGSPAAYDKALERFATLRSALQAEREKRIAAESECEDFAEAACAAKRDADRQRRCSS